VAPVASSPVVLSSLSVPCFIIDRGPVSHARFNTVVVLLLAAVKTHSNLPAISEEGSHHSSEDPDCEDGDAEDDVSALSFDTITIGHKSACHVAEQKAKKKGVKLKKPKVIHGNTAVGCPFLIIQWRDSKNHARLSLQLQLLSGDDMWKQVVTRVSTDKDSLVACFPMSPCMARSDFAHRAFLLDEKKLTDVEKDCLLLVLETHSKSTAHMSAVAKVKGRSSAEGFFCEQHIPLPRKVKHQLAAQADGDKFFFGRKVVQHPDGGRFLHLELVAEDQDGYVPVEVQADPVARLASSIPAAVSGAPMEIDNPFASSGGAVLNTCDPVAHDGRGSKRRALQEPKQQQQASSSSSGMGECDDDDDGDDDGAETIHSQTTMDATRAKAAELLNQVEATTLRKSSAPPPESALQQSALQQLAGMGPHEDKDDLWKHCLCQWTHLAQWNNTDFVSCAARFQCDIASQIAMVFICQNQHIYCILRNSQAK